MSVTFVTMILELKTHFRHFVGPISLKQSEGVVVEPAG